MLRGQNVVLIELLLAKDTRWSERLIRYQPKRPSKHSGRVLKSQANLPLAGKYVNMSDLEVSRTQHKEKIKSPDTRRGLVRQEKHLRTNRAH
jgi:hypothetical protein